MPRGRKKRVMVCRPPPRGVYLVDWTANELIRLNALSGQALGLWLQLKGLAWEQGECDPTDAALADLMGGIHPDGIRLARRALEERHLLAEHYCDKVRWLVPLPIRPEMRGHFDPDTWAQLTAAQSALEGYLSELRERRGTEGNSPQALHGGNSISGEKEEEELIERYCTPPHLPTQRADIARASGVGGAEARSPGTGSLSARSLDVRGGISPRPAMGEIELPPGETGGECAVDRTAETQRLVELMVGHGVFPTIAREVAAELLARLAPDEAQAHVLAHVLSIQESKDLRQGRIDLEMARGRLATRLRDGAVPPAWALDQARETLEAPEDDGETGEDATAPDAAGDLEPEAGDDAPLGPSFSVRLGADERQVTASELWDLARGQLRLQMTRSTYDLYLAASTCTGVDPDGATLVVACNNALAAEWLKYRLSSLIRRTLRGLGPQEVDVRFEGAK